MVERKFPTFCRELYSSHAIHSAPLHYPITAGEFMNDTPFFRKRYRSKRIVSRHV